MRNVIVQLEELRYIFSDFCRKIKFAKKTFFQGFALICNIQISLPVPYISHEAVPATGLFQAFK
jgi:hypothetical protein